MKTCKYILKVQKYKLKPNLNLYLLSEILEQLFTGTFHLLHAIMKIPQSMGF